MSPESAFLIASPFLLFIFITCAIIMMSARKRLTEVEANQMDMWNTASGMTVWCTPTRIESFINPQPSNHSGFSVSSSNYNRFSVAVSPVPASVSQIENVRPPNYASVINVDTSNASVEKHDNDAPPPTYEEYLTMKHPR